MSVQSLTNIKCNVYFSTFTQDIYGANYEELSIRYAGLSCRINYLTGQESFYNGKEQNPAIYRFYFPKQLTLEYTDKIIDYKNRRYEIVFINKLTRSRHMQVDAKLITQQTGDICPNIINSFYASIIPPQSLPLYGYLTVESNGTSTKDHFLAVYSGDTTGYEASDKIFYGDYNSGGISGGSNKYYQSININNVEYWIRIDEGVATSSCCTDVIGTEVHES
jgi:hypothetical protein